jgi:arylsulfatase
MNFFLHFGFGALTAVFLWAVTALPVLAQEAKPNVVFILSDNVGYGDLGPYGGGELRGAPTPRIDQLAREGLRLTQYLVEPGCTPSRAALMTGQYSIRNGLSLIIVKYVVERCGHDGRIVQGGRLCDGNLRQVARWR